MNFQQLRSVRETVRRQFNLTDVAQALYTSQPGVSRQIRELEEELGFEIFVRAGKRLLGLTEPGQAVLPIIERLLQEQDNLKRAGEEFTGQTQGRLTVATTHTQARYALPQVIKTFRDAFPGVTLALQQVAPSHIVELLQTGEADIGIATEGLENIPELVTFPAYSWHHVLLVTPDHPLATVKKLTLAHLATHPLITYDAGFTGRKKVDDAFQQAQVVPEIVLTAMDADVIKTYVEVGLGVGIVASMAYDPKKDHGLVCLDAGHLFADNITRVAIRRGRYLRAYAYQFMQTLSPALTREVVMQGLAIT
ncbi:CysB family HTH-type transcriptional regulator [Parvibium lacunae]|uniref:CysB family HTH-type transcriptional regulator n=1 Tax=Parvibium lacunae TaxID=1888893 RepID=A0A368L3D5_9BURK|nr:CysB family HTH-type transcriptional regulator [Parvibium lacunae]RCS58045.1 CysB family HTH-type transcriptional regulator [Parvibium lacunae]